MSPWSENLETMCDAFILERLNRFNSLSAIMASQLGRLGPNLGARKLLNRLQSAKDIFTAMTSTYDLLKDVYPFLPQLEAQWQNRITWEVFLHFFAFDMMLDWLTRSVEELEAMRFVNNLCVVTLFRSFIFTKYNVIIFPFYV